MKSQKMKTGLIIGIMIIVIMIFLDRNSKQISIKDNNDLNIATETNDVQRSIYDAHLISDNTILPEDTDKIAMRELYKNNFNYVEVNGEVYLRIHAYILSAYSKDNKNYIDVDYWIETDSLDESIQLMIDDGGCLEDLESCQITLSEGSGNDTNGNPAIYSLELDDSTNIDFQNLANKCHITKVCDRSLNEKEYLYIDSSTRTFNALVEFIKIMHEYDIRLNHKYDSKIDMDLIIKNGLVIRIIETLSDFD